MKNKTEIIYDAIQEIRTAVNAECIPIDELPKKVKELAEESANSGLTTAFVFSGTSNPNRPTANTLDLATGLVNDLDENWTQEGVNSNSVLMSFARFDAKGARLGEWSTPTNIKGAKGDPGVPGQEGVRGPQGLPGEKGEAGLSYRTVSVYTTTDSGHDVPATPKNGYWNIATNEITLPTTNVSGVSWKLSVNDFDNPKRHVWVSSVTFGEDGMPISKWSTPFRITGDDGKNGTDGRTIEFIYRQLPDYDAYISLWNHLGKKELPSVDEPNYVPNRNDDIVDTEWTDSPEGINSSMQFEVVCSRTRNSVEEPWGKWSNCAIWSKWGEDGMDGDGVEYIYLVTPAEINGVPTTSGYVKEMRVPEYSLEGDYQKDEFCFNDKWGFNGYDWTDEPRDVGRGEPMEWVMSRKYRNGRWERFSEPALWAKYSEDGVSYITSFVFTRATVTNPPIQPKGGDYYHAYPTIDGSETGPRDENWHDSVPADGTLPVWMSTRTFCSDFRFNDDDWSEPKMLTDTPDFQVEYSAYTGEITREKISKFEGDSTEENEEKWRAYQLSKYELTWGDDTKIKNPVWMITATRHGGEWSDWTISKIKGEKGDKGEAGSSVKIEGQFETLEQLKEAWEEYVTTGSLDKFHFESKDGTIDPGDGWYVKDDEKLYSYSGGWNEDEDDSRFETYWFGVHIKGEPGDSAYMYIAYCDENNKNAEVDLIGPGKYIGVKATSKPLSETDKKTWGTYTWTKWEGEDGWGQEQIFLATSAKFNPEKTHLPLPTENSQTVEFLPTHSYGSEAFPNDRWSDTPVTPTPDYPFCWVATRKCQGNEFGNWKGIDGKAALYSRWSYDGVNSVYVDLSNDLAVIPMEDGKVDPDFTDLVQTTVRVWVGDERVSSTDFIVTGNNVTIDGATVTLDLSALNSNVKSIPLKVTLGKKEYDVEWKILQTDVAYELAPKTYAIKRYVTGDKAGQLELSELVVEIWKWSDNKWIASNIPLFAYITYTDGRDEVLSTSDGRVTATDDGIAIVNFDGLLNIASIKVYVVAKNEKGEYLSNSEDVLSFENITVVADGKDGPQGPQGDVGPQGPQGEQGPAGTSISIKGHFTYDQLIAADAYFVNPTGTKPDPYFTDDTLVTGHCYVITSGTKNGEDLTGHMFIYDGSGDTFDERWADVGKLQGPAGQSQYLYIAFSDNDETVKILANGDIDHRGGKYIGYVVSNNVLNKDDLRKYKTYTSWWPWNGDDGWGWEQIFKATSDNIPPYIETEQQNLSESELKKRGWSDKPISISEKNKYIWYLFRKSNSYWQGEITQNNKIYAALFDHWTTDGPQGETGPGILSIIDFYLVSPLSSGITIETEGWKQDKPEQELDGENRYLWNYTQITYTDGREVVTDPIIIGCYGKDAISVNLSNEFARMSWYADGQIIVDEIACEIKAVRNRTPLNVNVLPVTCPPGFEAWIENNESELATIRVKSDKQVPGIYELPLTISIDNETIKRTISISVEEVPNDKVDIVMDRTIHVPYLTETQCTYNPWEFGETWFDYVPVLGQLWYVTQAIVTGGKVYETFYTPLTIDMPNIKAFVNGLETKNWAVTDITIGTQSLGGPDQNGKNEWYHVDVDNGFIVLNMYKFLNEALPKNKSGEFVCYITFVVENTLTVVSEVLIIADKKAERYDFSLSQYTMRQGSSARVYLYLGIVSSNGVSTSNSPLTTVSPKVELYHRLESQEDGKLINWSVDGDGYTYVDIENIQEDNIFAIWVYDKDGNKVGHGRQIVSCLDVPQQDSMSLKTTTPFIQVNEEAAIGSGKLMGIPLQVSIEHRFGDTITNMTTIPEGCHITVNDLEIPVLTAGMSIDFDTEGFSYLYKNLDPIQLKLFKNGGLIDILTIEKTIVYPDPIIYPAGVFDQTKSIKISYYQIPYVLFKRGDEIEYYIGNKNVLLNHKLVEVDLNTMIESGDDPGNYISTNNVPLWTKMDSFESVYADIGVFKQALVGPLVFYKDYVFSQDGKMLQSYENYSIGDTVSYDEILKTISFEDALTYWNPNYLVNAKTGDMSLGSTFKIFGQDGDSIIDVGNHDEEYFNEIKNAKEKIVEVESSLEDPGQSYRWSVQTIGTSPVLTNNTEIKINIYTAPEKGMLRLSNLVFRIGYPKSTQLSNAWIAPEFTFRTAVVPTINWIINDTTDYCPYLLKSDERIYPESIITSGDEEGDDVPSVCGKSIIVNSEIEINKGESIYLVLPKQSVRISRYNAGATSFVGKYKLDASYSFYETPNTFVAGSEGILFSSGKSFVQGENGNLNIHSHSGCFTGLRTGTLYLVDNAIIHGSVSAQTVIFSKSGTFYLPESSKSKMGDFFELWINTTGVILAASSNFRIQNPGNTSEPWSELSSKTLDKNSVYKCMFTGESWWVVKIA